MGNRHALNAVAQEEIATTMLQSKKNIVRYKVKSRRLLFYLRIIFFSIGADSAHDALRSLCILTSILCTRSFCLFFFSLFTLYSLPPTPNFKHIIILLYTRTDLCPTWIKFHSQSNSKSKKSR